MDAPSQVERWRRIEALFAEAVALPGDRRDGFLATACAGDEELRTDLAALLRADGHGRDLLGDVIEGAAVDVVQDRAAGAARSEDERLGPYRLIGVLGRGGMSSVHRAVRADDEYSKEVAVKTLQGGVLGPDTLERFRRERQILADLEHPHIARLLDGGTSPNGTPYVVMELVDGPPIDEYARRHRLDLRQRIALFRKVCSAVQYAHQRLVVHRDLKPSNILVQEGGTPKLLDFGIAKLLDDELLDDGSLDGDPPDGNLLDGDLPDDQRVARTVTALSWMTPEYASPEQVRGERVTTASDVYSLGAVLYELLTGRRPYEIGSRSAGEIERVVSTTAPAPPSAVLSRAAKDTERGAAEEGAPSTIRARQVRGDLDNIVLMALRKEPERRYRSAGELDDDLERFEQGLPVRSRPDTLRYRMRKFVRRHRLGVATAALLMALLTAFGAVTFVQARRLEAERDTAQLERDRARRVAGFFSELLTAQDDAGVPAGDLTARELLDRGAARLEQEVLDDQPAVRAAMLGALGEVYLFHGESGRAQALLEEALALRREAFGEVHLDTAESRAALGDLALRDRDLETAAEEYRSALDVRRRLLGEPSPSVAESLADLATVRHMQGEFEEAERLFRESLDQFVALAGGRVGARHRLDVVHLVESGVDPKLLDRTIELKQAHAHLLGTLGQTEEALAKMQETFDEAVALRGEDHVLVADIAGMLAVDLKNRERWDEAEPLYRLCLRVWRDRLGVHSKTAQALNNLAVFLNARGDTAEAGRTYAESVEMYTEVFGRDHPELATILGNYATWLSQNGSPGEARPLFDEAMALLRAQPGGDTHWITAVYQANRAACLLQLGEERRAEEELVQAVDVLLDKHPRHRGARAAVDRLLELYEKAGRAREAADLRARAVEHGTLEAALSKPATASG